jgi:hypothetical protein
MEFLANNLLLVLIGLALWPRMLLLYAGLVPVASVPPLFGFMLVPRMYLALTLSAFWDANPFFVAMCWVIAVILDGASLVLKSKLSLKMLEMQKGILG